MPKCENCYHHDICIFHGASGCERCMQYKDKSLIVELPCKVGDTVWIKGEPLVVDFIHIDNTVTFCIHFNCYERDCGDCPFCEDEVSWEGEHDCRTSGYLEFTADDIGKTVFLTREEAENALRESENNE